MFVTFYFSLQNKERHGFITTENTRIINYLCMNFLQLSNSTPPDSLILIFLWKNHSIGNRHLETAFLCEVASTCLPVQCHSFKLWKSIPEHFIWLHNSLKNSCRLLKCLQHTAAGHRLHQGSAISHCHQGLSLSTAVHVGRLWRAHSTGDCKSRTQLLRKQKYQ